MSNHDKHFSSFQHTKIINGKKIKDKKILISINPDDKQKIYAYFKENDHQYLYSDKLEKFSNLILSQSNSQFDLIQLLKSDLESLNNFDLFNQIKFEKISKSSKKYTDKKFKKLYLDPDFLVLQPKKDSTKKKNNPKQTYKNKQPKKPKKHKKPSPKKPSPKKPSPKKIS